MASMGYTKEAADVCMLAEAEKVKKEFGDKMIDLLSKHTDDPDPMSKAQKRLASVFRDSKFLWLPEGSGEPHPGGLTADSIHAIVSNPAKDTNIRYLSIAGGRLRFKIELSYLIDTIRKQYLPPIKSKLKQIQEELVETDARLGGLKPHVRYLGGGGKVHIFDVAQDVKDLRLRSTVESEAYHSDVMQTATLLRGCTVADGAGWYGAREFGWIQAKSRLAKLEMTDVADTTIGPQYDGIDEAGIVEDSNRCRFIPIVQKDSSIPSLEFKASMEIGDPVQPGQRTHYRLREYCPKDVLPMAEESEAGAAAGVDDVRADTFSACCGILLEPRNSQNTEEVEVAIQVTHGLIRANITYEDGDTGIYTFLSLPPERMEAEKSQERVDRLSAKYYIAPAGGSDGDDDRSGSEPETVLEENAEVAANASGRTLLDE